MRNALIFGFLAISAICLSDTFYKVSEAEQAIVTLYGKIQGEPITEAGLHWKIPFFQDVRYFDKRILSWDGDEEQIPTKDKKYIWVDTTARWQITDTVKFAQSLHNESQAKAKLDTILDGITRDTISNHNLVEAVRNTNGILDRVEALRKKAQEDPTRVEEELSGDVEPIAVGREQLSRQIIARAAKELEPFGINLIDVQLRRIAYEASVEKKVYERMISERNRIAEKIRSIGKGEVAKIKGKLNRDLKEIESNAYRKSQQIKGKADAQAIEIYASSLGQDPSYYRFLRKLEAYKKTIPQNGHLILSTDSEFLKGLVQKP